MSTRRHDYTTYNSVGTVLKLTVSHHDRTLGFPCRKYISQKKGFRYLILKGQRLHNFFLKMLKLGWNVNVWMESYKNGVRRSHVLMLIHLNPINKRMLLAVIGLCSELITLYQLPAASLDREAVWSLHWHFTKFGRQSYRPGCVTHPTRKHIAHLNTIWKSCSFDSSPSTTKNKERSGLRVVLWPLKPV